jgi:hypothetical protein
MTNREMDERQIVELIQSKITAETVDSGWMVALLLMRMMETVKEITHEQMRFQVTFAEYAHSLNETLKSIASVLKDGEQ